MSAFALSVGAIALGGVLLVLATRSLRHRFRERRLGRLVRVDTEGPTPLRSRRYRLVGRPDELRVRRDGRVVPVELKQRSSPYRGAFYSHTVQLWAYCLLVEETTGRAPPFGVLRYRDRDVVVPWNPAARQALLTIRREASAPYDGRADPTPGKCLRCAWSERCDASAARGPPAAALFVGPGRPR